VHPTFCKRAQCDLDHGQHSRIGNDDQSHGI
jgi:hypothetical protein